MYGVFLANHFLDACGLYLIVTVAIKITMRKPIRRWFF